MISILMSVYDEPIGYVKEAVNSILEQNYSNFELIIVVDNPSNKEVINLLKNFANHDKRLRLLFNLKNMGLVYSLNKAFKVSKGNYIARMDADDISSKFRITEEINLLKKDKLDLVASNIIYINEQGEKVGVQTKYPVTDKDIKRCLKYIDCLPHPTWLVKREVYSILHGYRNIKACEDYDFLIRGTYKGFKYGLVSKPLLKYRINNNSISHANQSIQIQRTYYIQRMYKNHSKYTESMLRNFLLSKKGSQQKKSIENFTGFLRRRHRTTYLHQFGDFIKQLVFNGKITRRALIIKLIRSKYSEKC